MDMMTRVLLPPPDGIRLTKLAVSTANSQETTCFSATLVMDGRPLLHARNDGSGGETFVDILPPRGDLAGLEARMTAWLVPLQSHPTLGQMYAPREGCDNLAHFVDILVERMQFVKGIKRQHASLVKKGFHPLGYVDSEDELSSFGLRVPPVETVVAALCHRDALDPARIVRDFSPLFSYMTRA